MVLFPNIPPPISRFAIKPFQHKSLIKLGKHPFLSVPGIFSSARTYQTAFPYLRSVHLSHQLPCSGRRFASKTDTKGVAKTPGPVSPFIRFESENRIDLPARQFRAAIHDLDIARIAEQPAEAGRRPRCQAGCCQSSSGCAGTLPGLYF